MSKLKYGVQFISIGLLMTSISLRSAESDASTEPKPAETASRTVEDGGTGPYPAVMVGDSTLPTHTIFRPKDLNALGEKAKLPIIAWGNGGCADSPQGHLNFLSEVASHGYLVIAIGPMQQAGAARRGGGGTMGGGGGGARGAAPGGARGRGATGGGDSGGTPSPLTVAIDWAIAQNSNKDSQYFNKIDTNKVAVSGMSCGGLQALAVAHDPRVTTAMICNSGIVGGGRGGMGGMPSLSKSHLEKLHAPIIYILGGESDIAYANGMDDFRQIKSVPAFTANLSVGHGGTYMRPHGGEFAIVATAWLQWQLKGDKEAAKLFEGDPCGLSKREGWKVEKKNIP